MTELIAALDGPNPYQLLCDLWKTDVRWFKIGPLTRSTHMPKVIDKAKQGPRIFYDLKLADTESTCREAVKRFADYGIAAVSTFTDRATEAAIRGAEGSDLRVWRVLRLSDDNTPPDSVDYKGRGIICSVAVLQEYVYLNDVDFPEDLDRVCPGIRRLQGDNYNGHTMVASPQAAVKAGASHIVVGQPIWRSDDPVKTAKEYLALLRKEPL